MRFPLLSDALTLSQVGKASACLSDTSNPIPKPKSHHIVPRLHLQHFAGDKPKGQVWTYDKNTGGRRSAIPDETATFTNFYSIELENGGYDTTVEGALAANESDAAPIYEKLLEGEFPKTSKARARFAVFLAYLYFRTKASFLDAAKVIGRGMQIMNYAYGSHPAAFEKLIRTLEEKRGEAMPPETKEIVRRGLLDPSGSQFFVPRERAMMSLVAADRLAQILLDMKWSLAFAKHGFLITSDNPLVRIVDPKSTHSFLGDGGFINPTAQVTLALGPKTLLILSQNSAIPDRFALNRDGVDACNQARAFYAEQFLYSHMEHEGINRLATRFKRSRPTMTTEGFGPERWAEVVMPRRSKQKSDKQT